MAGGRIVRISRQRTQTGISLIEQVMVVAVVAVLACVAMPSLGKLVQGHQLQATQFTYLATLRYARNTAITHNSRILFCPSVDGRHCRDTADWTQGWLIARDRDRDGQPDGPPLRTGRVPRRLTVLGTAGRKHVRFLPDGTALGSNLSLLFCSSGDDRQALRVVVSNAGRVRGAAATPEQSAACAAAAGS